jgi:hypothetical protein
MIIYTRKTNDQTPRRTARNARRQAARLAIRNRKARENGGPERLDVAALKERLAERKAE